MVGVPVSPVGTAPEPREPVDLTRMASPAPSATGRLVVPHPTREPSQTIRIDRVLAAPGLTAIEWTLGTTQSRRPRTLPDGPPAVRPAGSDQLLVAGGNPTNGPIIRVGRYDPEDVVDPPKRERRAGLRVSL